MAGFPFYSPKFAQNIDKKSSKTKRYIELNKKKEKIGHLSFNAWMSMAMSISALQLSTRKRSLIVFVYYIITLFF